MNHPARRREGGVMGSTARWLGWQRVSPRGGVLDASLARPLTVHAVADPLVGGYGGVAGRALCGAVVPKDDGDRIVRWETKGRECSRCAVASARIT